MSITTVAPAEAGSVKALRALLGVLTVLFVLAAFLYELGPLVLNQEFFQQLPFVSNSVVKVGILLCCCLYARGDLRERRGLVVIVIVAHLVSVVAMAIVLLGMDTTRIVDPGIGGPSPVGKVLIGAMVLDGVITTILIALYLMARAALPPPTPPAAKETVEAYLTPAEQWLRRVLIFFGVLFVGGAVLYLAGPLSGVAPDFFRELPFVTNSVVKVSTLAMVCFWVAGSLRQRMSLVGPVIFVHFLSGVAQIIYLLFADSAILNQTFVLLGRTQTMSQILWGAIALDGVIGVLLMALYMAAWRARLDCRSLRPTEYRTLAALAEVMTEGKDERISADDAARNVDRAMGALRTERKRLFPMALIVLHYFPLFALWPPLPEIDAAHRSTYLKIRFKREAGLGAANFIRNMLQALIRVAHQLAVLGYYSDARVHRSVGYTPFSARDRYPGLQIPVTQPLDLKVDGPWDIPDEIIDTEVLVIGSGAGGAILAYSLAEQGKEVLLVERGQYVDPAAFAEDELSQLETLYDGGLLQVASDNRFGVLQGSCVGGSTTVNNAICFPPPSDVVARWNQAGQNGHDSGLSVSELEASTRWVREFLEIKKLGSSIPPFLFHKGADKLSAVIGKPGADTGLTMPEPFDCNIKGGHDGCYGCGKCNIGCPYNKKLSMLYHTLPRAQREFGKRVRIISECEVEQISAVSGKPQRIADVRARLGDGRRVTIRARSFVLAAGALASSHLMLKNGIGRGLPVGKGLAFNMVAPVMAEFGEPMNSYDGIQMGHYVNDQMGNRFLIETWYSLPVGLALTMGGWFDEHFSNMCLAGNMAAYGMVVGTDGESSVFHNRLTNDMGFHAKLSEQDKERMVQGLDKLARVLFDAGAKRVIVNTWDHGSLNSPSQIPALLKQARDQRLISLASAHPQGGNAIGRNKKMGVLDENFRAHGYSNLFVADASVFPTSLQVNPQMTVMALSRYAAARIAALTP
jgi:choline dehydrogenase-like flavoprotein